MEIAEVKKRAEPIFKSHGVSRASVFGSVARGSASDASDIDILLAFSEPMGMIAYTRLIQELSLTLGREVDVVTEGGMNPHIRPYIMRDAQIIYED